MHIDDFIWLPDFVEKIYVKHHVTQDEAEEIFFNEPYFRFVDSGYRKGEDVYSAWGQTDAGRYLNRPTKKGYTHIGESKGFHRTRQGYSAMTASRKMVFVKPLISNAQSLLSQPVLEPAFGKENRPVKMRSAL